MNGFVILISLIGAIYASYLYAETKEPLQAALLTSNTLVFLATAMVFIAEGFK